MTTTAISIDLWSQKHAVSFHLTKRKGARTRQIKAVASRTSNISNRASSVGYPVAGLLAARLDRGTITG
jgi:hypothetical protein